MGKQNSKLPTLDLHGRTTDEVYDLIDRFITQQVRRGSLRVRIMPGKGLGKVKSVVIEYLKQARYPWQFETLANGNKNEGVMLVFLD